MCSVYIKREYRIKRIRSSGTTWLYKLDKINIYLQQFKEKEVTEPIPATTLKGGTPIRVMLRDLTIFNPVESINLKKILPYIANIGGGAPSTRWKGKFMECTWTSQPERMMNGLKKIVGRKNNSKMSGPSVQGVVKMQLEIMEVVKASLFPHRFSLHCALTVECPRLTYQKWLDSTTSQTRGVVWGKFYKLSQIIYYFICFTNFLLFRMSQKVPGLTKYTFQQGILPYQK